MVKEKKNWLFLIAIVGVLIGAFSIFAWNFLLFFTGVGIFMVGILGWAVSLSIEGVGNEKRINSKRKRIN